MIRRDRDPTLLGLVLLVGLVVVGEIAAGLLLISSVRNALLLLAGE